MVNRTLPVAEKPSLNSQYKSNDHRLTNPNFRFETRHWAACATLTHIGTIPFQDGNADADRTFRVCKHWDTRLRTVLEETITDASQELAEFAG